MECPTLTSQVQHWANIFFWYETPLCPRRAILHLWNTWFVCFMQPRKLSFFSFYLFKFVACRNILLPTSDTPWFSLSISNFFLSSFYYYLFRFSPSTTYFSFLLSHFLLFPLNFLLCLYYSSLFTFHFVHFHLILFTCLHRVLIWQKWRGTYGRGKNVFRGHRQLWYRNIVGFFIGFKLTGS